MGFDDDRFRMRLRQALRDWEKTSTRRKILETLAVPPRKPRDQKTVFTNWLDPEKVRDVPFQAVAVIAAHSEHSLGWFIDEPALDRLDRVERKLDDLTASTAAIIEGNRVLAGHLARIGKNVEVVARQRARRARGE